MARFSILFSAWVLFFVLATHASAQTANATLGGTVADTTGALIPGMTITATNTETGIVNTVLTNESGVYQFASLQPGNYRVTAELTGFQTQVANSLRLNFSEQARFNFTMQVGALSTSLDVSIAAEAMLASSSSVGSVLPEYKVNNLPLANRDVLALTSTMAGVVQGNQTASFAGSRTGAVQTMVNGISVNDGRYQTGVYSATQLSPDLVDEVRILVSPADAETGRGSGQVQVSTRSGTNQFRGSVFYTNHNSALDSNTWFNNFNGVKTGYSNRNQFGAHGWAGHQEQDIFLLLIRWSTHCTASEHQLPRLHGGSTARSLPVFSGGAERQCVGFESDGRSERQSGAPCCRYGTFDILQRVHS